MLSSYPDVLTVKDICEIFHVGKKSVYQMLRDNKLPNRKVGRSYRIPKKSVTDFFEKKINLIFKKYLWFLTGSVMIYPI